MAVPTISTSIWKTSCKRVNSDLVGKVINIASRCAGFIFKQFDGVLADKMHDEALWDEFTAAADTIAEFL